MEAHKHETHSDNGRWTHTSWIISCLFRAL